MNVIVDLHLKHNYKEIHKPHKIANQQKSSENGLVFIQCNAGELTVNE